MVLSNRKKVNKVVILIVLILVSFTFLGCRKKPTYKYESVDKRDKILEISEATYTTNQNVIIRNNKKDMVVSKISIKFTKKPNSTKKEISFHYDTTIHIVFDKEYIFKAYITDYWSTDAFSYYFYYEEQKYDMYISFRKDRVILQTREHIKHLESGDGIYYDDLFLTLFKE